MGKTLNIKVKFYFFTWGNLASIFACFTNLAIVFAYSLMLNVVNLSLMSWKPRIPQHIRCLDDVLLIPLSSPPPLLSAVGRRGRSCCRHTPRTGRVTVTPPLRRVSQWWCSACWQTRTDYCRGRNSGASTGTTWTLPSGARKGSGCKRWSYYYLFWFNFFLTLYYFFPFSNYYHWPFDTNCWTDSVLHTVFVQVSFLH